jgi:hypothetical protein
MEISMTRITDANLAFVGHEPKFSVELTQTNLIQALNWYSQNKDSKDAYKYSCDYFKKKLKIDAADLLKNKSTTFGFTCRILSNGGTLPTKNQIWFDNEIEDIRKALTVVKQVEVVVKEDKPNIQDRLKERASDCIGELEGQIDDLILSDFTATVEPYAVFHTMGIKGAHTKTILEWAKKVRAEFDAAMITKDADIKEGYSNFTKPKMKKIIAYCDQVILDCNRVAEISTKSRKPRKRKAKSPDQLVMKVKVCDEFKELGLKSVSATSIIGANQLWVYNTKTRKLGVYNAEDAGGLSVKGSSIINFAEKKSVQKKLRKPEKMLPDVLSGGKVFLRNVIDSIRAVESPLTGRLNADTILLKVTK